MRARYKKYTVIIVIVRKITGVLWDLRDISPIYCGPRFYMLDYRNHMLCSLDSASLFS